MVLFKCFFFLVYLTIYLFQKTFYQTPKTKDTKVSKHSDVTQIAMIQHGPISPGYDDEYDNEHILVPPLPPSHLQGCSLINISYYVEVWSIYCKFGNCREIFFANSLKDIFATLKFATEV